MVSLRDIRRRIHSVNNIKQITKAMELVAGSKLQKAEAKSFQSRLFLNKTKEILDKLSQSALDFKHPLFEKRTGGPTAVVIVGGDRGLCGSYNAHIIFAAEEFLKKLPKETVELVVIGRKIADHFQRKKWKIVNTVIDWGGKITYPEVVSLGEMLTHQYLSKECDEIWIIYTEFISLLARKIRIEPYLSIVQPKVDIGQIRNNYILEPNLEEIYQELLPRYLASKLQNALDEAYASELAARIFSMKTATKNAEDMIDKLTLERNKVRQASITKEITEIVAGAEST